MRFCSICNARGDEPCRSTVNGKPIAHPHLLRDPVEQATWCKVPMPVPAEVAERVAEIARAAHSTADHVFEWAVDQALRAAGSPGRPLYFSDHEVRRIERAAMRTPASKE